MTTVPAPRTKIVKLRFVRSQESQLKVSVSRAAVALDTDLVRTYFPEYRDADKRRAAAAEGVVVFELPVELANQLKRDMSKITDGSLPVWQLGKNVSNLSA